MTKYITHERAKYWPVSAELMAQYKDESYTYKDRNGLCWLQNSLYHRDGDKPAIIGRDGSLQWYQNGLWHRDGDLPAIIYANGGLSWWQNGLLHRICGPARIYASNHLEWWINDEDITPEVRKWLNKKPWRGTPEQIFEFQLRFI